MSAAGAPQDPMFLVVSLFLMFVFALALAWGVDAFLTCGDIVLRNVVLRTLGLVSASAWFTSAGISLGLSRGTIPYQWSVGGNVANLVAALTTGMCAFMQNVSLSGVCS